MFTQAELSKRMRDQLYLLDPEISLEVGTPERKIIDIVAQSLTDIQFEKFVQEYPFDVDTKFGQDLDDFVQLFGFARQTARRATGFVVFQRKTPGPTAVFIPAGTQVSTTANAVNPLILFTTVADAVIPENGTYVEVPIEATSPGVVGNVSANKINKIVTPNRDFSTVNNLNPISGGTEQETDDALRVRFKNNIFRNISGTDDQFLALAVANQFTNRARIIGPVSRFEEYLTIDGNGTALSFNPNAKYVYDFNYYLSTGGNETATFYDPNVDYTLSVKNLPTPKPEVAINNVLNPAPSGTPVVGTAIEEGSLQSIYEYSYSYVYSPGGESSISPSSESVTFVGQNAIVGNILNSSGTSLAGGSVVGKNVYRKDLNGINANWERVGTVALNYAFDVTGAEKTVSGTVVTATVYLDTTLRGTGDIGVGGNVVVSGISTAVGTAMNGTFPITNVGTASISYSTTGTAFGSVTATGTANAETTVFLDNYLFAEGQPPSNDLSEGSVVFLEHEYLSKWSRNVFDTTGDYSTLNKVDIFISGQNTTTATDVTTGPGNLIVNDYTSKYHYANFERYDDSSAPEVGNYFINLIWTPVRSIPSSLTIDGNSYQEGLDYWLIKDVTNLRESYRSRDGIEITAAMANVIDQSVFSIDYSFDKLPVLTNRLIETHRQVGQDVLVHTAKFRNFRVNLVVIYTNGFNTSAVNNQISDALEAFFNQQLFGAIIQLNDIIQIVYQVAGVDNARIATTEDDVTYYGIQEIAKDGTILQTYQEDFILEEIELPALYSLGPDDQGTGTPVAPLQKTQNNWIV